MNDRKTKPWHGIEKDNDITLEQWLYKNDINFDVQPIDRIEIRHTCNNTLPGFDTFKDND